MVILLDTTVLVYAVGAEHPLRDPCRRLLDRETAVRLGITTTVEVVQEFLHARSRRSPRPDAVARARDYADAFELIQTTRVDLQRGLELYQRHPELGAFDAVLAGVAHNHGADGLVSADHGFAVVPGLRWIDPAGPLLDRLLAT